MALNELHRLAYLQAMGMTNYMPRKQLVHAPAAQPCEWQPIRWAQDIAEDLAREWRLLDDHENPLLNGQQYSAQEYSAQAKSSSTNSLKPANIAAALTASTLSDKTQAATSQAGTPDETPSTVSPPPARASLTQALTDQPESRPATATQTPFQTTSKTPSFSLSLWRVSSDWLIIDSRHSELALPTETFLKNLLSALNIASTLPETHIFRWPLLSDPLNAKRFGKGLNQDEEAARESLSGFLDEQLVLNPARFLWVMGQDAIQYVLPAQNTHSEPQVGEREGASDDSPSTSYLTEPLRLDDWNLDVFRSPSLADFLQSPDRKAELWRQWLRWAQANKALNA